MMHNYDTVSEALSDLKKRGFAYDFNIKGGKMACPVLNTEYDQGQLQILETYRFEGPSDPADEAVVFGLEASDGVKGVFVDGYGAYYDEEGLELLQRMQRARN